MTQGLRNPNENSKQKSFFGNCGGMWFFFQKKKKKKKPQTVTSEIE